MRRAYIVACTEHGPMTRDEAAGGWVCTTLPCGTYLADADVFHLVVTAPPPPRRRPVRVMVSDHCVQRATEVLAGTELAGTGLAVASQ